MNIIFSEEEFKKGIFDQVFYNNDLQLQENVLEGHYISEVCEVETFKKLVASWQCQTVRHTYVEVKIRVFKDKWSQWFSYGKWSDLGFNKGSIANQTDEIAFMMIDEIVCREPLSQFQYQIVLSRRFLELPSPKVSLVHVSVKTEKIVYDAISNDLDINIDIEVPMISQMLIHDISSIVCSPAAVTMVTNYYGMNFDPIDVAQGSLDQGEDIYGNWSYNMAYVAERGFDARVEYCSSPKVIMGYIQQGIPIVLSVNTKEKDDINNAPQAYPSGHLLVVRGFVQRQETYVIVNDPASQSTDEVKRYYKLRELMKAWNLVMYVIKPKRKKNES